MPQSIHRKTRDRPVHSMNADKIKCMSIIRRAPLKEHLSPRANGKDSYMSGITTRLEHRTLNKRRRTCIQEAVPDGCVILIHTQREHAKEHHQAPTSSRYPLASTMHAPKGILTIPGTNANCHQMLHAEEGAVQYKVPKFPFTPNKAPWA